MFKPSQKYSPCKQCGYFGCDRELPSSPCRKCVQPKLWHDTGEFDEIPCPVEQQPEQADLQIDYFGENDVFVSPEKAFLMAPDLRDWAKRMEARHTW